MKPQRGGLSWIAGTSLCLVLAAWCQSACAQEVVSGVEPFQAKDYTVRRYGKGGAAQRAALAQLPSRQRRSRPADIQRQSYQETMGEAEEIPPGTMTRSRRPIDPVDNPFEDDTSEWSEGPDPKWQPHGEFEDCGGECCRTRLFGDCCLIGPWIWDNFSVFGGVQGFKGRPDFGFNGNFGFHEGFNWGTPLIDCWGIGSQAGLEVVHSDLSGSSEFNDADRTQVFYTGGIFHRPVCGCGFQGGVVSDYLHDDYYVEMDLGQIRAELSYVGPNGHELGCWVAAQTRKDSAIRNVEQQIEWKTTNLYAFFYRRQFCTGATGRFWSGFTGNGEAIIGADAIAPLSTCWSIEADFNYRIPKNQDTNINDAQQESWGMAISLVWTPAACSRCGCRNPYRPLFNVANNSTMMINQKSTNVFLDGEAVP